VDASESAYERVIRFLARRSHARAELLRKLHDRGVPDEAARQAVDRAAAQGYVDDTRFAAEFAHHAREQRGWAPPRTRSELLHRGVARDLADAAVASEYAGVDLLELALVLARKRAARLSGDREQRRRRLALYLERRGYPVSVCRAATDEVAPL
jgi:regulatory protein